MSGLHRDINVPHNFLSSRRLQKPRERTGGRAGPGGGRAPALLFPPIRLRFEDYAPPPLRIKENHAIMVGLIRRPIFIWRDYISRPPGP